MAELAPDQLAQVRQNPEADLEAVLQWRLFDHGLGQRLHLGLGEIGRPTRKRLVLEVTIQVPPPAEKNFENQ